MARIILPDGRELSYGEFRKMFDVVDDDREILGMVCSNQNKIVVRLANNKVAILRRIRGIRFELERVINACKVWNIDFAIEAALRYALEGKCIDQWTFDKVERNYDGDPQLFDYDDMKPIKIDKFVGVDPNGNIVEVSLDCIHAAKYGVWTEDPSGTYDVVADFEEAICLATIKVNGEIVVDRERVRLWLWHEKIVD